MISIKTLPTALRGGKLEVRIGYVLPGNVVSGPPRVHQGRRDYRAAAPARTREAGIWSKQRESSKRTSSRWNGWPVTWYRGSANALPSVNPNGRGQSSEPRSMAFGPTSPSRRGMDSSCLLCCEPVLTVFMSTAMNRMSRPMSMWIETTFRLSFGCNGRPSAELWLFAQGAAPHSKTCQPTSSRILGGLAWAFWHWRLTSVLPM
jgi:hypothetical protein